MNPQSLIECRVLCNKALDALCEITVDIESPANPIYLANASDAIEEMNDLYFYKEEYDFNKMNDVWMATVSNLCDNVDRYLSLIPISCPVNMVIGAEEMIKCIKEMLSREVE